MTHHQARWLPALSLSPSSHLACLGHLQAAIKLHVLEAAVRVRIAPGSALTSMVSAASLLNPGLYRQLGRDPAAIIEAGKAAMRERFEAMR